MTLSAVIITKNEEENIERCIKSVSSIADEIVVVDSGSTDSTVAISKKLDAKVYFREFDNYASQRNYAIKMATKDWILSLDADEEIPDSLSKEIKNSIRKEFDAFLIPRRNIIFGKEIKYSRYSPDKHVWLFKKDKGKFVNSIHEEVQIDGKVGELVNGKIHHSHPTVSAYITMINSYTDLEAEEKIKQKDTFSLVKLFYYPTRSFIGRFILKQGFRDGIEGFVLCSLRAYYHLVVWMKVWEKEQY